MSIVLTFESFVESPHVTGKDEIALRAVHALAAPLLLALGAMYKYVVIVILFSMVIGCAGIGTDKSCGVSFEALKTIHKRSYAFMESQGYETECEELSGAPTYLKGHGCALYGNATFNAKNQRTGADCPMYLDGGYYIIFSPETLQPKEVVFIQW